VNPGEYLAVLFSLQTGMTYQDVVNALNSEDLRIGIHVQGFANGGSESFINDPGAPAPVPEPSTLALVGAGMIGIAALRRKIKR
jgi:hypothetical protein